MGSGLRSAGRIPCPILKHYNLLACVGLAFVQMGALWSQVELRFEAKNWRFTLGSIGIWHWNCMVLQRTADVPGCSRANRFGLGQPQF